MPTASGLPTALTIPATAAAALLPDPNLSILQLLEFPLAPASTINITKLNLCPSTYFSSDQPNVDDFQTIKMIPIAPVDIIGALLTHAAGLSPQAEATNLAVNKPDIIKKVQDGHKTQHRYLLLSLIVQAFQLAGVRGLNLSHGSLTSFAARETLRQLKTSNSDFWKELEKG